MKDKSVAFSSVFICAPSVANSLSVIGAHRWPIGAPSVADFSFFEWLKSDVGLATRIAAGVLIFAALAAVDLRRRGHEATRWRENLFLLLCVGVALLYGAANDQITSTISWEYFYYGKELDRVLGPNTPPDPVRLHLHAALVGMKATWSAGLIVGVALLLANNPRRHRPQLSYATLARVLAMIFAITACCGIIGGLLGYFGGLTWVSTDFVEMTRTNIFRPRRFIATWGVHLGGYVGGLVGIIVGVIRIKQMRRAGMPIDSSSA
jgi:hypothetical protein